MVALPAREREREAEPAHELRCPGTGREHDGLGSQLALARLELDPPGPGPERPHLDARPHVGPGRGSRLAERQDVAKRVDVRFLRVQHGPGEPLA